MATYPSSIISFPTRVNGQIIDAGDINSPDSEITAIQSFVGTQSSTFGMTYDLRSPNSNGGGHVQTANKGGTGQTSYNKGDILVASSSSVLSKQAAGPDGYVPTYDSTQSTGLSATAVATEQNIRNQAATYAVASVLSASVYGITFPNIVSVLQAGQAFVVKWPNTNTSSVLALQVSSLLAQRIVNPDLTNIQIGAITPSMVSVLENDGARFQLSTRTSQGGSSTKVAIGTTPSSVVGTLTETTLLTFNVSGGTLGTNSAIKGRAYISSFHIDAGSSTALIIRLKYGGTTVATQNISDGAGTAGARTGFIDFSLAGNAATNAQVGTVGLMGGTSDDSAQPTFASFSGGLAVGTATEDSTTDLACTITVQFANNATNNDMTINSFIVQKII